MPNLFCQGSSSLLVDILPVELINLSCAEECIREGGGLRSDAESHLCMYQKSYLDPLFPVYVKFAIETPLLLSYNI